MSLCGKVPPPAGAAAELWLVITRTKGRLGLEVRREWLDTGTGAALGEEELWELSLLATGSRLTIEK